MIDINSCEGMSRREHFLCDAIIYDDRLIDSKTKIILDMFINIDYTGQYLIVTPEKMSEEAGVSIDEVNDILEEYQTGEKPLLRKLSYGLYAVNSNKEDE